MKVAKRPERERERDEKRLPCEAARRSETMSEVDCECPRLGLTRTRFTQTKRGRSRPAIRALYSTKNEQFIYKKKPVATELRYRGVVRKKWHKRYETPSQVAEVKRDETGKVQTKGRDTRQAPGDKKG